MEDDKLNITDTGPVETTKPENLPVSQKSWYQKIRENEKLFNALRIMLWIMVSVLTLLFVFVFTTYLVPRLQETASGKKVKFKTDQELKNDQNYKKQTALLSRDIQRLSKKYMSYTSGQSYIVINTTDNRFFL